MLKHRSVFLAASLAAGFISSAAMAEAPDGVVVISDNYYPYGVRCDTNRVVTKSWCNGSYCDNMLLQCGSLPSPLYLDGVTAYIAHVDQQDYAYGWTSDEFPLGKESPNATCEPGHALTGMYASGSYSDNVRAICHPVYLPPGTTLIVHPPVNAPYWISDGEGGVTDYDYNPPRQHVANFGSNTYFSGVSCSGSYCDNMWYGYTEVL